MSGNRNQWCQSPDHHEWLHMLLDRRKEDLNNCYLLIDRQGQALRAAGITLACCDLHGRNCEPPSELCCKYCTEADHPEHRELGPCSNPDLSPNSPAEPPPTVAQSNNSAPSSR